MTGEPPMNLQAEKYEKGGVMIQKNIPGKYRLCAEPLCETWIGCPFVKCQKHRTDFAIKDTTVPEFGNGK